jgi:hypothetical protein
MLYVLCLARGERDEVAERVERVRECRDAASSVARSISLACPARLARAATPSHRVHAELDRPGSMRIFSLGPAAARLRSCCIELNRAKLHPLWPLCFLSPTRASPSACRSICWFWRAGSCARTSESPARWRDSPTKRRLPAEGRASSQRHRALGPSRPSRGGALHPARHNQGGHHAPSYPTMKRLISLFFRLAGSCRPGSASACC